MPFTTRTIPHRLRAVALALALAVAGMPIGHCAADDAMAPNDKALNQLYWQGQEALKKADWPGALKLFTELERQLRVKEPQGADAAVYWEAYTLLQAKRNAEAKAAVERLHHDFPHSRWNRDADALVRQVQPQVAHDAASDDEDMADIAVEGLLSAPPARALPLLKKVLASQHSDKVKKRALFVLSQIDQDAALDAVVDVAKTSDDKSLREEAIRMLGVGGQERAIARLRELYAASKDAGEKRTIVQAWLSADRKDLIFATARDEADPGVRRDAIQALGALDAASELKQLFDSTHDAPNQRAIIQALGVSGDVQSLSAIAVSQQPEDIRVDAIHALGIAGDKGGSAALVRIYSDAASPALRDAALQGLVMAGDSQAMLTLYRQAKTREEKQALLRRITNQGGDAALDVIEQELDKK